MFLCALENATVLHYRLNTAVRWQHVVIDIRRVLVGLFDRDQTIDETNVYFSDTKQPLYITAGVTELVQVIVGDAFIVSSYRSGDTRYYY
jgi:hypothetical protein